MEFLMVIWFMVCVLFWVSMVVALFVNVKTFVDWLNWGSFG